MIHPFADMIGLEVEEHRPGFSKLNLKITEQHLNPNGVVHGAVLFALADTGMGEALYQTLAEGELCATIEVKINYFKPVLPALLTCTTEIINRGKSVANLESRVWSEGILVAQANGNYAIFRPRNGAT